MKNFTLALAVLALAGYSGGCGDSDEGSSVSKESTDSASEDFATEAEAACIEASEGIRDVNLDQGYAPESQQVDLVESLLDARQSALAAFEDLEPPADLVNAYEEFLAARRGLVEATEDSVAARESQDTAATEAAETAIGEAAEAVDETGAGLEIDACAGVLPGDEAEAAEKVLLEFSTTTDPSAICESGGIATEAYVVGLGGVQACLSQQKKIISAPGRLPEDVAVSDVGGVEGVVARFEYEEIGGGAEGEPFVAALYYLDGEWQIYSVGAG